MEVFIQLITNYCMLKPHYTRIGIFCDLVPQQFRSAIHFYSTVVNTNRASLTLSFSDICTDNTEQTSSYS